MMKQDSSAKKAKKPNILVRLLVLLITAALVVGALLLVVYRDRFNLDAVKRWLAYRSLETSETGQAAPFTHAGGDKLSVAYLTDGVLTASTAGAHYYSFSGDQYAEEVRSLENPVLSVSGGVGAAYDAGGQALFVFRDAQETLDLSLEEGQLISARVNSSGWLAVTAQQSGYKGAVTVYDRAGEPVIQISLSSTFVVDAALSPDCGTVAVVTIGQEGGSFRSQVLFYPVDEKEPSAQADLGNVLALDLDYEDGLLWVLGENQVMAVSQDGGAVQRYSFGRMYLKGCSLGGDGFAFVLLGRYRAGSAEQAQVIGPEGTVQATLELSGQVLDFDSAGSYCALLTGSTLTIYTAGGLEEYARLDATQGARYAALSSDGSVLLADEQQAWMYIPG